MAMVPADKAVTTIRNDIALSELGETLTKSGFFADVRQAAQATVKVLYGQELGFGPVSSMAGIHIIKGKLALSANLIAAQIKKSNRYNYKVTKHTADECIIDFYENDEVVGTSGFSMEDAKTAKLLTSDGMFAKYPRNMLFSRAISNGARWYCPDIFGGSPVYTPDELGAHVDGETGEIITIKGHEVSEEEEREEAIATHKRELYDTCVELAGSPGPVGKWLKGRQYESLLQATTASLEECVEYFKKPKELTVETEPSLPTMTDEPQQELLPPESPAATMTDAEKKKILYRECIAFVADQGGEERIKLWLKENKCKNLKSTPIEVLEQCYHFFDPYTKENS